MLLNLIFWLSGSSLAVEILLARVFAVSQWHHLTFMVISLAMFGFAAGGTYWSLTTLGGTPRDLKQRAQRLAEPLAVLYALSVPCGLLTILHLPLDYFRLPLEPVQLLYLLGIYPLLALPFFICGLMLSYTFAALPEQAGRIYFATMAGSAAGAVVPGLLLELISEVPLIVLLGMLPAAACYGCPSPGNGVRAIPAWRRAGGLLALAGIGFQLVASPTWPVLEPNPYKALFQVSQFPATRIVQRDHSLKGRLERVHSPYLRFAPGISLQFSRALPVPEVLFRDGDSPIYLYPPRGEDLQFARQTLSYCGYRYHPGAGKILLIIQSGGLAAACALAQPGRDITLVSGDSRVAAVLGEHYQVRSGSAPRRYLARDRQRYDLIHLENWGYSVPGTAALEQDYLLTREAFTAMLAHLNPDGVLVLARRLLLPPADAPRIWATAYQALEALGAVVPGDHLAIFRNWDTVTYLIGRSPLENPASLLDWAAELNFDPVYLPGGVPARRINRFNQLPEPYLHQGIEALAQAVAADRYAHFLQTQHLELAPARDLRPYPNRFLKWSRLTQLYEATGQRFYSLWMSGELVVMVVLVLALVLALAFLWLPLPRARRAPGGISLRFVVYFLAVGAGFMGIEMYLIHIYTLLSGHSVVSLALTLGGLLFFAGLGGLRVQRRGAATLKGDLIRLVGVLAIWLAATPFCLAYLLRLPTTVSLVLAAGWLAPPAFFMGIPFAGGLAALGHTPRQRCFGWSMNGIASVVGAVAAVPLALTWGDTALGWAGWAAYGLALGCVFTGRRPGVP